MGEEEAVSAELLALGGRAAACPGWMWMPGMSVYPQAGPGADVGTPHRLVWAKRRCGPEDWGFGRWYMFPDTGGTRVLVPEFPNLYDPTTVGCLLALVREALGEPNAYPVYDARQGTWSLCRHSPFSGIVLDRRVDPFEGEEEGLNALGRWGTDGLADFVTGDTEAHMLVAALGAAGRRTA